VKKSATFTVNELAVFSIQMLNWANRFNIFCLLDNRAGGPGGHSFDCMLAAGAAASVSAGAGNALQTLRQFSDAHPGEWLFGHLAYDLKNETLPGLQSSHPDATGFADIHFFVPEVLLRLQGNQLHISSITAEPGDLYQAILRSSALLPDSVPVPVVQHRLDRDAYTRRVMALQRHIHRGDCYEVNFCQEFFAEAVKLEPVTVYQHLVELSPNPFAACYRVHERYCFCASPERYLRRTGNRVISQPMKGTARRYPEDPAADDLQREMLSGSAKERSENVMVVDLVRNDLSRVCKKGSVQVDELFGIYSFPQVHQMISTVSGIVDPQLHWTELIRVSFPMGSMTGAPKKRVLELIEQYEQSRRGLFSGAIGYVAPGGDFDFNVVIRSLLYNSAAHTLSFHTGSAITAASEAGAEYEECLLKAAAIRQCLAGNGA
jgi:para-aminobenzoate synthetase component 1